MDIEEKTFENYDEAMSYRDSFVENDNNSEEQTTEEEKYQYGGRGTTEENARKENFEDPKFQLEGTQEEANIVDVEALANEMSEMDSAEIEFEDIVPEDGVEVNPVEDAGITDEMAQELGFENAEAMMQPVENFEGIPMFPAMSDILSAGVVKDSMGNDMETNGGLQFNTKGK